MLAVDRGTGVGFHIKWFRRYGGGCEEDKLAEAINVCITS